ncbi:ErfK/YbiS/YcfS/YnhG family protein [Mycobacteroides abscessus subsp. massiliense]|uniref:L,D-transpeptidase n=1 Tax=Mycobacteroides abscessus TaxID=36809 RepID=UPI0009D4C352|nr:Ig-like domain-containing protein [Mycobacteroides abscessus]SKK92177.1 ErfK/YbiS/YcfS/YnhG family protein [Mycobacteroides abscessus subsp. massiliense]
MTVDRRIGVRVLAVVLVLTGTLGVVVAVGLSHCWGCDRAGDSYQHSTDAPRPPADLVISPGPEATDVDPLGPVTVSASFASVSEVTMTNEQGVRIVGVTTPDGAVWKPGVPLGYGRTYTITATATAPDGTRLQRVSTFSTVVPGNQTRVRLTTTSGADVRDGATYGIGTVVVARFDEPIVDQAAAERRLVVSTAPAVTGSWYWLDNQTVHWRPAQYFAPGTAVTVQANIYGAALGGGLYGQEDVHVGFVIGDAHVAIADDATKQVSVFNNGHLVRTMPTSMGMGGTETVNGQTISFWTQRGIYTVMDKANPVVMDSSTYGLPINSRLGYRETISWATRISTDGIYLHQLESTVWAQGNTNVSHGCLNLNPDNARWFYDFSQPGDVVEVRNTGGEPLQVWQNGDWSVPWEQWVKGSALR